MHEMGIAENIIKAVEEELRTRGAKGPVASVTVRVGKLHAAFPESLRHHFDELKALHAQLKNTVLKIHEVPITIRCRSCGREMDLRVHTHICDACGGDVEVAGGEEMEIEDIEV